MGGYTGKFFNELLQKEGVPTIFVKTENFTRENMQRNFIPLFKNQRGSNVSEKST
jgi:hypothetical protein